MGVAVMYTSAAANNVNLVDIGTEADDDGFVDGITAAINSNWFQRIFPMQWCIRNVWWSNNCSY